MKLTILVVALWLIQAGQCTENETKPDTDYCSTYITDPIRLKKLQRNNERTLSFINVFVLKPNIPAIKLTWVFAYQHLLTEIGRLLKRLDTKLFHIDADFVEYTAKVFEKVGGADDVLNLLKEFVGETSRMNIDLSRSCFQINFNVRNGLFERFAKNIPELESIFVSELQYKIVIRDEDIERLIRDLDWHLNSLELTRVVQVSKEISLKTFQSIKKIEAETKKGNSDETKRTITGYLTEMRPLLKDGNAKLKANKNYIYEGLKKIKEVVDSASRTMYYLPQDLTDAFLNDPIVFTVETLHLFRNFAELEEKKKRIKASRDEIKHLADKFPSTHRLSTFDENFLINDLIALLNGNLEALIEIDLEFFDISPRAIDYVEWFLKQDKSLDTWYHTIHVTPIFTKLRHFLEILTGLTIDSTDIFETNSNYFLHVLKPHQASFGGNQIKIIRNEITKATLTEEMSEHISKDIIWIQKAMVLLSDESVIIRTNFGEIVRTIRNQEKHRSDKISVALKAIDKALGNAEEIFNKHILSAGLKGVIQDINDNLKNITKAQIDLADFLEKYYPRLPIKNN